MTWDDHAAAIHAGRAHARALSALRALAAEPVRRETRASSGRARSRSGVCDESLAARRDAILDEAVAEGADRHEIIRAWQADTIELLGAAPATSEPVGARLDGAA